MKLEFLAEKITFKHKIEIKRDFPDVQKLKEFSARRCELVS